ncbi:hypothetical protein DSECCO2_451580 [anaerobic digester metagenome]
MGTVKVLSWPGLMLPILMGVCEMTAASVLEYGSTWQSSIGAVPTFATVKVMLLLSPIAGFAEWFHTESLAPPPMSRNMCFEVGFVVRRVRLITSSGLI